MDKENGNLKAPFQISVADPKKLFSDPDLSWQVITDPDPDLILRIITDLDS